VKFHPWTHAEWTSVPVEVRWTAGLPKIRFQNGGISQVLAISMGKMLRIYWNRMPKNEDQAILALFFIEYS
jgi:hypothetical protein